MAKKTKLKNQIKITPAKKKIKISRFKKLIKRLPKTKRWLFLYFIIVTLTPLLIWLFWDLPLPSSINDRDIVSTKIFDRNDNLIYEVYADKRRTPIKLDEIPDHLKKATIAVEDKDFYKHPGFSITGIGRAFYKTLFQQKLQGGSTLTQQLVKVTLLSPERTVKRKIREFVLSTLVEAIYSKDQILEMYLNQIPYGSTAYGIEAASELYFNKKASELNLAESATLAGLTAAPSRYSPFGSDPDATKVRQELVLSRMVEDGYISQEEADEAKKQELNYKANQTFQAPHFALWVKEQLAEKYGDAVVEQGGLRVKTSLDLEIQGIAEKAVADEISKLEKQKVGNGAALVTRPKTGEILAMVGSKNYWAEDEDGKVNILFAKRQPGSSIKPLNYALGIRDEKITAASVLADVKTCFSVIGQEIYCPVNYDGGFHGAAQTRFALGNSYNIPAVRTLALNGIENFIDFSTQMGITTFIDPKNYGLSLTLGGGEVKPSDMAVAYGVFANQGIKQPLISILKVEDWKGKVLEEIDVNKIEGDRVLSQGVAFIISHILHDNNARLLAFGERSFLNVSGHPEVAVKTGTTNDRRDNWTIGYTSQVLALSWVGNNDNSPMSGAVSGVSGASPIWNKIIKAALDKAEDGLYDKDEDGHSWPKQPSDVIGAQICANSGTLPIQGFEGCPQRFEYFLKNTVPQTFKGGRLDVQIDKTTGALASPDTPPENIEVQNKLVIYDPLDTPVCLDCQSASSSATIRYPR